MATDQTRPDLGPGDAPAGQMRADSAPDSAQDLADDIAYVRSLAEEGRNAPLIGGVFYVIWGGLMAAASFAVYLNALGVVSFGRAGYMAPWIAGGAAGWILSFTVGSRAGAKPGAATLGNRTAFSVWFAVGLFMTLFWASLMVMHARYAPLGVPSWFLFGMMYPVGFGVYGVAFFATATAARVRWLKGFAALAWAFSAIGLFLLDSPHMFLAGGIGMIVCAFLPGVILMRREPSEIV